MKSIPFKSRILLYTYFYHIKMNVGRIHEWNIIFNSKSEYFLLNSKSGIAWRSGLLCENEWNVSIDTYVFRKILDLRWDLSKDESIFKIHIKLLNFFLNFSIILSHSCSEWFIYACSLNDVSTSTNWSGNI